MQQHYDFNGNLVLNHTPTARTLQRNKTPELPPEPLGSLPQQITDHHLELSDFFLTDLKEQLEEQKVPSEQTAESQEEHTMSTEDSNTYPGPTMYEYKHLAAIAAQNSEQKTCMDIYDLLLVGERSSQPIAKNKVPRARKSGVCAICGPTSTPVFRYDKSDPSAPKRICNACGMGTKRALRNTHRMQTTEAYDTIVPPHNTPTQNGILNDLLELDEILFT